MEKSQLFTDATNMPATTSQIDIAQLMRDFPDIKFAAADTFYWSAQTSTVHYCPKLLKQPRGIQQLLHEVGHALEGHLSFRSGIELLRMESEAWEAARQISQRYNVSIDDSHVERCLDSYRDWLHLRSKCPQCQAVATETAACQYRCFNCSNRWSVSPDQRTRCYRRSLVLSS